MIGRWGLKRLDVVSSIAHRSRSAQVPTTENVGELEDFPISGQTNASLPHSPDQCCGFESLQTWRNLGAITTRRISKGARELSIALRVACPSMFSAPYPK